MEHFQEVLNRQDPVTPADIRECDRELEVNTDPPTMDEVIKAIKSMKNGKVPGDNQIKAELLKADPQAAANTLYPKRLWSHEEHCQAN
jgi:hypothetical protein